MSPRQDLERLADLYGLETSYEDVHGRQKHASDAALRKMLEALGAPATSETEVQDAFVAGELALWRQRCEPVTVVQEQSKPVLPLRVPQREAERRFRIQMKLEHEDRVFAEGSLSDLPTSAAHEVAGETFVKKRFCFDCTLPLGYHVVQVELCGELSETLVLCPPGRAWNSEERSWGVFAPLYALHSERSPGAGDYQDLEELIEWVHSYGGNIVGTLPLLPTFLDEPFDPSPYAPVSRLFWNEFYLDIDRLVAEAGSDAVRAMIASPAFVQELRDQRERPLVDFRRQMALKRRVLTELAQEFFAGNGRERKEYEAFLRTHPRVRDYAEFRAATELAQKPWPMWPEKLRSGTLGPSDFREADVHYHLYVQWRCTQQMETLGKKARSSGLGLYLDLPLGVHDCGYDVWRERDAFLLGCSLGAPPDPVFSEGQRWGITPLHPVGIRQQKYRYFVECIRHHMECSGALRVDHVMGLHRVCCVPAGMGPHEGVYLRYRPKELYAILALESQRTRTIVVGEDLGTVPQEVRDTMRRVGVHRMHVLQYELDGAQHDPMVNIPGDTVASVNTHDLPTFASWWAGSDIEDRIASKFLTSAEATKVHMDRDEARKMVLAHLSLPKRNGNSTNILAILSGILTEFASSRAAVVVVNLEDLWLEREPQNVPGTGSERPNWRRKFRHSLEAMREIPEVLEVLRKMDQARRGVL